MRRSVVSVVLLAAFACKRDAREQEPATTSDSAPTAAASTAAPDSLTILLARLEPKLHPVTLALDSMIAALRPDSGTARADSTFVKLRPRLDQAVNAAAKEFADTALLIALYPDGAMASMRARDLGVLPAPPDAKMRAATDSLTRFLGSYGIWAHQAEGDVYFEPNEQTLLQSAGPLLSPGGREFLELTTLEQTRPTGGDASLLITWDQLGERVVRMERYLSTYPASAMHERVRERYLYNLRWFLLGSDNTPAFHRTTRVLEPVVRRSYERYIVNNPSTASGKLIREYLDLLRGNGYRLSEEPLEYLRANSGLPANLLPRLRS